MKETGILLHMLSCILLSSQVSSAPSIPHKDLSRSRLRPRQYLATEPHPQYVPQAVSTTAKRTLECKNCPYGNCLNALAVTPGTDLGFACWTYGESINNERTWLRHHYGTRTGDFCYINPYDLQQQSSDWYRNKMPYCGTKSELNFYLPKAATRTELYTECSLCPYRDCDGIEFYQAGVTLEINCVLNDGWMQVSPLHPGGTRKYYRTNNNCYVSAASVKEIPLESIIASGPGVDTAPKTAEMIPPCGPVPHLKLEDRPKYSALLATRAVEHSMPAASAISPSAAPSLSLAPSAAPVLSPSSPSAAAALSPPPEEEGENEEDVDVQAPIIVPSSFQEEFGDARDVEELGGPDYDSGSDSDDEDG